MRSDAISLGINNTTMLIAIAWCIDFIVLSPRNAFHEIDRILLDALCRNAYRLLASPKRVNYLLFYWPKAINLFIFISYFSNGNTQLALGSHRLRCPSSPWTHIFLFLFPFVFDSFWTREKTATKNESVDKRGLYTLSTIGNEMQCDAISLWTHIFSSFFNPFGTLENNGTQMSRLSNIKNEMRCDARYR